MRCNKEPVGVSPSLEPAFREAPASIVRDAPPFSDPNGVIQLSPGSRRFVAHPGFRSTTRMNPEGVLHEHSQRPQSRIHFQNALLPKKPLVILDVILLQEPQQLCLKLFGSVVFLLARNVCSQRNDVAGADGEGGIATLPLKVVHAATVLFDPLRSVAFQVSKQVGDGHCATKVAQNVNVILDTPDLDRGTVRPFEYADHVGIKPSSQGRIFQERTPILGRENNVQVNLREGLRHGEQPLRKNDDEHREYAGARLVDNPFRVDCMASRLPRVRSLRSRPWAGVAHPFGVKRGANMSVVPPCLRGGLLPRLTGRLTHEL